MECKMPVFTPEEQEKLNQMFNCWMIGDLERKVNNFKALNKTVKADGILFVGDSITEGYPLAEMYECDLGPMYNRGISGITSGEILDNIQHQILDVKAKTVVLLVGTNDIERAPSVKEVAPNIKKMCEMTIEDNPEVRIFVEAVYPVNKDQKFGGVVQSRTNEIINQINMEIVEAIKDMKQVTLIDLNDTLSKDNQLNEAYTYDGLHLSIDGYRLVTSKILEYIK